MGMQLKKSLMAWPYKW